MSKVVRFGISLPKGLSEKFDRLIKEVGYPNRSEAIRELIRKEFVSREWAKGDNVAGSITLVYDHSGREFLKRLTEVQHHHHHTIISTQHIHLDHHNCLEIVIIKGKPREAESLLSELRSIKGLKHVSLAMATTGKKIP
ncbi:MAG: nickel-responsive transcriptional regulator NikR [Candidatus Omnitrophica bacterium]|nr:nickel-responsive transcriptional regulator NikR [Candidatus Omnitrophota bacterium]